VSITKVLTGLHCGQSSVQLKLLAAYCGAKQSYGKASQELNVHHGHTVERTKLRRMAHNSPLLKDNVDMTMSGHLPSRTGTSSTSHVPLVPRRRPARCL
jgi:phage terminase small subunit